MKIKGDKETLKLEDARSSEVFCEKAHFHIFCASRKNKSYKLKRDF